MPQAQIEINVSASAQGLRCGPSWCFGRNGQGSFVQYLDGTNTIALDGLSDVSILTRFPILDRFLFAGSTVYDAATGEVAAIGKGRGMYGVGTSSEPSTIIHWDGEPGTFTVLNLAAVPPAQWRSGPSGPSRMFRSSRRPSARSSARPSVGAAR